MPSVTIDSSQVPKPPRLVHVTIPAEPSRALADMIHVLVLPHTAMRPNRINDRSVMEPIPYPADGPSPAADPSKLKGKEKQAAQKQAQRLAPVQVVAVSHLCGTFMGRREVLRALRGAGVPGQVTNTLGWATTIAKGELELGADGKRTRPQPKGTKPNKPAVVAENASEPETEPVVDEAVLPEHDPEPKGKGGGKKKTGRRR